ncbi:hypothetical protein [Roseivirga sp. E12]|uniref:hypothetical protein n=1 Tax=Roseivirga sp. E12 TaxID=2819237 RepID=UPI001ABD0315|nr:hypothetical protein [Roseivirga sp. E12]MBO3700699.1 hypothetical protein [Roseivirga sp. E12]
MNKKLIVAFVVCLFVATACGQRAKYVESDVIEILVWGDIDPGEWIEIDGLKLVHAKNDTLSGCQIDYFHDYVTVNDGNTSDDHFFLPSTTYYVCVDEGKFTESRISPGDVTQNMLSAMNDFAKIEGASLQLPYKNGTNLYEMSQGKMRITRTDGKPIRISTSANYKAQIGKATKSS